MNKRKRRGKSLIPPKMIALLLAIMMVFSNTPMALADTSPQGNFEPGKIYTIAGTGAKY